MTSWYSNLLTKTSSQISSLRSTLLSSETDGDTEDDTHVCRVLRNYYTEKGRPSPAWLPPDPKGAAPAPQPLYAQPQVGSRYGGMNPGGGQQQAGPGAAGFGSLWDNKPVPQQLQVQTQSLRAGRTGQGMLSPVGPGRDEFPSRPAPGRNGSYSNQGNQTPVGGSAQDRLRQRLWGGARTTSPSAQNGPFQPPPSPGGYSGGAGGAGGNYEDRFAPGGAYDNRRGAGPISPGSNDKPYMGSNAPWSSGGDDYMGGGGGGGGGGISRRQVPSGQRGYR